MDLMLKPRESIVCALLVLISAPLGFAGVTTNLPTSVSGGSGAVADIQYDDTAFYTAAKGNTITVGTFDAPVATITSVVLHVEFSVESAYSGSNAIFVAGSGTGIVPVAGDTDRTESLDITGGIFGIDTWPEIESLAITFHNNDGSGPDSVTFDYMYLVVTHGAVDNSLPTWSEEFEGTGPADPAVWWYEEGYQRNNEDQYYMVGATNGWQENGEFIIEAREEVVGGYQYTSASIRSKDSFSWMYGRSQIRAKIPATPGMWPAIWQVGDVGEWPYNGECDIMEYYGEKILANCAVGSGDRWTAKWDGSNRTLASLEAVDPNWRNEYHIWSIQWDQDNVRLYVDNILMNTIPQSWLVNTGSYGGSPDEPFKQPHSLWLNLAVGGNAGGNPAAATYPQRYYIDYWRIWEGATNNAAPTDIHLASGVGEGLPAGTIVGELSVTDSDPAEVIRYALVAGTGDDDNLLFSIPEFVSDRTDKGLLKTAAVLNYDDSPTRSIRVKVTDIEGATLEKVLTVDVLPDQRVMVSSPTVSIPEGGTGFFSVKLRTLPSNTITVNVSKVSGDADLALQAGALLTFTPANATNWQQVTLGAAEDADMTNGAAIFLCEDPSATYSNTTITAYEFDNDNTLPEVDAGSNQTVGLTGSQQWLPTELAIDAWYDASDTNSITASGGTVSQWNDKSVNNNDLTAGGNPQTGSRSINGLNVIDFSTDDFTMATDINMVEKAVYLVVESDDITSENKMLLGRNTENVQLRIAIGGALEYRAQDPYYNTNPSSTALVATGRTAVVGYQLNTNMEYSVDGTYEVTDPHDGSGMTTYNLIGRRSGGNYFDGVIGEVVFTTGLLSGADRQDLEGYLAHKWGVASRLPSGHDHKALPPSLASATANLDGTVSDANGDPFTVAWSVVSGPGPVSFDNSNAVDTVATFLWTGTYVLRLTADDGVGTASNEVTITVNEGGTTHDITASAGPGGSVSPSGVVAVSEGANQPFTITPDTGYYIDDVVVDSVSVGPISGYTFTNVTTTHTIDASFAINQYTVVFNEGDHGSRTGGGALTQLVNHASAAAAPTMTPDDGYNFTGWDAAFASVTSNMLINALYAPVTYSVTYDGNGSDGGSPPGDSNSYTSGETVTVLGNTGNLTQSGYTFIGWNTATNGSGAGYVADDTFAMGASNVTLYAQWTLLPTYTLTVENGTGDGIYLAGADVPISADPPQLGYSFSGWTTTDGGSFADSGASNTVYTMPATNATVTAGYVADSLPDVFFATASASCQEDAGSVNVTVLLSHDYYAPVTVEHRLATPGGTATAGSDFSYAPGSMTFNPGETNKSFAFGVINDSADEADETLTFEFGALSNCVAGTPATAVYTILMDTNDWYTLPFYEPFEERTPGDLDGQYGWISDGAVVQAAVAYGGSSRAGAVTNTTGTLRHSFTDSRTRVWSDMRIQAVFCASVPQPLAGDAAALFVSTNGQVIAFDGTNAVASGRSVAEGEWARFTVCLDYPTKTWKLYVDDVSAGTYGFYDVSAASFQEFVIQGGGTAYVDDVAITTERPDLPILTTVILVR